MFSANSHEHAANAIKSGRFAPEIIPVSIPQRKGDPIVVDTDEGVRPGTTTESVSKLRPAFDQSGTITAARTALPNSIVSALVQMGEPESPGGGGTNWLVLSARSFQVSPLPKCPTQNEDRWAMAHPTTSTRTRAYSAN
ncbi:MAG: hypothetical protein HKL82_08360 [Acidimicrobiaceae bacterium]|nr:hypothetical protein [Acidimicrobiaceae bacterium]